MDINAETVVLGLLGNPVGHSLSPLMHNQTFAQMGLNCVYLPFLVPPDNLAGAIDGIRSLNLRGVNVTIPFKEAVIPYLDELSDAAAECGAVNVIKNERGRLIGYNTDGMGFIAALQEEQVEVSGSRVLFIGAGGAARSLAAALKREGASLIQLLDMDYNRAQSLAAFIEGQKNCSVQSAVMNEANFNKMSAQADIIINCSPVGMHPGIDASPVQNLDAVEANTVLCDIIYNPPETRLLNLGAARGLKTINGLSMFVHQGALTLEILLGINPDREYMKKVLQERLE